MSFEIVLPTGENIASGTGGKGIRKTSTGYHLKHLFMGTRAPWVSSPRRRWRWCPNPRPSSRLSSPSTTT